MDLDADGFAAMPKQPAQVLCAIGTEDLLIKTMSSATFWIEEEAEYMDGV